VLHYTAGDTSSIFDVWPGLLGSVARSVTSQATCKTPELFHSDVRDVGYSCVQDACQIRR